MIEHIDLIGRLEQILMVVLPVNIDQVLGHLLEHAERDRIAVEAHRASPAGVKPAGEQQFAAVGGDAHIGYLLDLLEQVRAGEIKDPADPPLIGAGAEHLGGASQAKKHFDGPDHQALAGAGCAGETIQSRAQFDAGIGDDGEIGNVKFAKHEGGETLNAER